ncbi:MAG: ABC transporter ATP-binding protein [Armatimonadota bacterium]|nr:ABC transporter ATP-binding protein [Armatimonadota bacterium]MDR7450132.1 ABC transporter ATP-binding protein [Armatimonadota bacterium]MDR7460616.1 ABC transporter ATP-binding protein [Armatimonadota bacterium]MDR7480843.1 ABC transporter ATP-binding protein [Armatimonadota bacterium]MDR7489512.1 ABC transporter ATP-binding protein [Armatimonadota bacterium]
METVLHPAAPGEVLVEVREATRTYRLDGSAVHALRGVTLEVRAGEFLAIVGPSGSGKSTLLHLMGGVDLPTAGEVRLFGQPTHRLSDAALSALRLRRVGFVFQRFFLLPMLTLAENVLLPMLEAGVPPRECEARVAALLRYVGLERRARHLPGQLSGGELQRGAIARALANGPALLLADEPTGELDQETGRQVADLLGRVHAAGVAVVVVTHNPELAARAPRVLTIRDGVLM